MARRRRLRTFSCFPRQAAEADTQKSVSDRVIEDAGSRAQFPAVEDADGDAIGSVGMTGAAVSVGAVVICGVAVTIGFGVALAVGIAVGALVGIDALPRTEQVHPTSPSSSASSGIKKNRFMIRISFRFFSDSLSRSRGGYTLAGRGKLCYTAGMRASIEFVKNALNALQKTPNRALGQNFCIDGERLSACVDRMTVCKSAIEIGPGLGGLTELLLPRCETLTAVEKDETMAAYLKETLPDPKLSVLHGDALKFRYADVPAPFSVVGNLPYYITTPLCSAVLKALPASFYCMVQKEAADRFFAAPKDPNYGPLSILVQLYYDAKTLAAFPPECFYPNPDVQSVFVGMTKRTDAPDVDPSALVSFATGLLSMRRKTIKNNLKQYQNAADALTALGIAPDVRAETLPPETILALYRQLF